MLVVFVVGGAAYNEWSKARAAARAEAFGDAMLDAMDIGAPEDRAAAIAAIPADGGQLALRALMQATDAADTDKAAALAALAALAADQGQPQIYRDLADLRRVLLAGADCRWQTAAPRWRRLLHPGGPSARWRRSSWPIS